ncbi:MAG: methyltransferase domain-containing protein [Candidatus Sulfotelmatobacter sp.]|jgi:SAM-dependent methyltransferase
MKLHDLWSAVLGRRMTRRLMKLIVPDLIWNQQIYGTVVLPYVTRETTWLDLGCGWRILGKDLEPIEDALVASAGMAVGCDVDLQSVRKHRNMRRLVLGSAEALPFRNASFDLITCNMVVEHLSDPQKSFSEMVRILSPGGQLVIHTPNLLNYAVFLNHTLARLVPRGFLLTLIGWADHRKGSDIFPTFYRANSARRLLQICDKLGLQEESRRFLTPPQPFFSFFAPLALIQILLMRLTMSSRYFRRFGATILMVFRYGPAKLRSASERTSAEEGLQTTPA